MRDKIANTLCNFILRTIATPDYGRNLGALISYGMAAVVRDAREGRPAPLPWQEEVEMSRASGEAEPKQPSNGSHGARGVVSDPDQSPDQHD